MELLQTAIVPVIQPRLNLEMGKKSFQIFFSGIVQGVGFRFTARSLALRYGINGWVKNLPDGRVELKAEGLSRNVVKFLDMLRETFKSNITDYHLEEFPLEQGYDNFRIVY